MIVHERRVSAGQGGVTVAARVEAEQPGAGWPDELWFTFAPRFAAFVSTGADGFAAALLPLAMHRRERLVVRGDLSPRLAHGLREYQRYQSTWKPDFFAESKLSWDELRPREDGASAVGTAFSGGVDSFHTLLTHLGDGEVLAPYRISHCLMINGFDADTDLEDGGHFARLQRLYEPVMERHGLELVVVRTNLLEFHGPEIQKQSFAAFVTAPALVLGGLFARFYVPSSYRFTSLGSFPDGSHPMFDHLLATEAMETIHDGGHLSRIEKTVALSSWPESYDLLRVCSAPTGVQADRAAVANCCTCEKCVRTMATLEVAGALERYRCFPRPLSGRNIRRLNYWFPGTRVFAHELIDFARRAGRRDIVRSLRWSVHHSAAYRGWIWKLARANERLERRSSRYAALVAHPKRLVMRSGLGRGWLYY